jgi:GT2 family glycosyltransferase
MPEPSRNRQELLEMTPSTDSPRPAGSGKEVVPAPEPPLVSILVVTYNALPSVRACLEGIQARTRVPHEVVVVDNASREETRAYLRSLPWVQLIQNEENRLWAPACNQAMLAADPRSRYLLLLNSDVEIRRDDWLEVLVAVLESAPNVGIVGPHHIRRRIGPVYGTLNGDCFMFRREVLSAVGLFDEAYPWAGANQKFTIEAFRQGWIYRVLNGRDRVVHHHRHVSREADPEADARIRATPRTDYLAMLRRAGFEPTCPTGLRRRIAKLAGRRLRRLWEPRPFYYTPPLSVDERRVQAQSPLHPAAERN